MRTYAQLLQIATSLAQNVSAANQSLVGVLIDEQHRLLLQKYFDNERQFMTTTVGAQSLTLTTGLIAGATSATLTTAWAYPSNLYLVNFSDGEQRMVSFVYNSTAITWLGGLTGTATANIGTVGVQNYNLGAYISKLTDMTITVGQLRYTPIPVMTRQDWDYINTLPYNSDIPAYFFIYNNQVQIFPIPATTGYIITFNYKTRVPDLSYAWNADWSAWTPGNPPVDYADGTIADDGIVAGSTAVIGNGTGWNSTGKFATGVDLTFASLYLKATPPTGDGFYYQVQSFTNDTHLTLINPVLNAPNFSAGGAYIIGQLPLLFEDFQLAMVYGALSVYYSSIVSDPERFKQYQALYQARLVAMEEYISTKSVNVNLGENLYQRNTNLNPISIGGGS